MTVTVKVRKQPPVDSINHTKFITPDKTEIMELGQIQDRCIHNNTFRQMRDPDLHTDLQEDPPMDLQADLKTDLQTNLQVRIDLQPDLRVHQGLEATNSPLVLFQAETSNWKRGRNL